MMIMPGNNIGAEPAPIPMSDILLPQAALGDAAEAAPGGSSVKQINGEKSGAVKTKNAGYSTSRRPGLITPFLR